MNVRFNVAELVGVVAETLSSIDVRTASVLIEGKWQNVMTVVRLSWDSAVTASARVEEIWGKHGAVNTDEFRIDYKVLAFTEWAGVLTEFSGGQLRFAEAEVELGRAVDVGGSLGYVQSNHNGLWPESEWPTLEWLHTDVPKEEDCAQLLSVRTMLLEDWKGDLPFVCEVVMFTAAPECPVRSNSTTWDSVMSLASSDDVKVIDANGLSEALVLLQERKEEQFFKRFAAMDVSGI
jgi:hypothetical protein